MKEIYLDNAATSRIDPRVLKEMMLYYISEYGNPSSFHNKGKEAKEAVENARKTISLILNCQPKEIIFTSGGSESINLALKGVAFANKEDGNHVITTKIEHPAVLETCSYLSYRGFEITYLGVNKNGRVNPKDVENEITNKTILISVMYANNEIGSVQDIEEIGKIANSKKIYFHTDAYQASGFLDLDVKKLGVDLLSLNGSKVNGPKGAGLLYIKEGVLVEPLIHGGGQESGYRSGTEDVPEIVGIAKALQIAFENREEKNSKMIELRDYFISELLKISKSRLNGDSEKRLPNNVNISFLDVEGESMLLHLNEKGIYASSGSACTSKSLETSHVLRAIGLPYEASYGSLRIIDKDTGITDKDIEEAVLEGADTLEKIQNKLKVGVSNKGCIPEVEQLIRFYKEKYFWWTMKKGKSLDL